MLTPKESEVFQTMLPFWDHLEADQKALLCKDTIMKRYEKGATIYNGFHECIGILAVKSGRIRTYMLSKEGKDITLFRLYQNEVCVLSASCLMRNITFDVHVDADLDTELFVISAPTFAKIMDKNIYVENYVYKAAVDKFSEVMWTMEQILFMSFDQRLAVFLLDECQKTKSDSLSMTHSQIATYIGSAREVVSRMLKRFEEEGIVSLSRNGIHILDRGKLKNYLN